jgi:hypothetical protein
MRRVSVDEVLAILKDWGVVEEEQLEEQQTKEEHIKRMFIQVFGAGIKILPPNPEPKPCYMCGGSLFWISKHDAHLRCVRCHPPASEDIVAGRVE